MRGVEERLSAMFETGTISGFQRQNQSGKVAVDTGTGDPSEVFQYEPYGFCFYPDDGNEALLFSPGGYGNYTFSFLAQDRKRKRPDLQKGEAALYAGEKEYVRVSPERGINLLSKSAAIEVSEFSLESKGKTQIKGKSMQITNGKEELFTIIDELLTILSTLAVKTDSGLILPDIASKITALKTRVGTFK